METRQRPRRALWALGILLAASMALNVALAAALQLSFAKIHFGRIFPLGFVPQTRPEPAPAPGQASITFWGDSRAQMWDKAALAASMSVDSDAHGSMTSTQLLLQLAITPVRRSDFALVQIGINDLHPLGALGPEKQKALEALRSNIPRLRDRLLERSDVVVLTTIFPPGTVPLARRLSWDPATLEHIDEVNRIIRASADGQRVIVLDAHALLAGPDALMPDRYGDGDFFLHVNREAYAVLNEKLLELLARHRVASR